MTGGNTNKTMTKITIIFGGWTVESIKENLIDREEIVREMLLKDGEGNLPKIKITNKILISFINFIKENEIESGDLSENFENPYIDFICEYFDVDGIFDLTKEIISKKQKKN